MARPSEFDRLPPAIRDTFTLKVRSCDARPSELVSWLESEGIRATIDQAWRWTRKIKGVAAAAEVAAEARLAEARVERSTGEVIPPLDPLEHLRDLFMRALEAGHGEVPRGMIEAIRGATMLESAFIARQKLALDRRSAQPEGNPAGKQITNEGIKWVRENVYGIFDDADRG
jgi:hypothetical protein